MARRGNWIGIVVLFPRHFGQGGQGKGKNGQGKESAKYLIDRVIRVVRVKTEIGAIVI